MLTAQVLCTNAFYKQVQTERGIKQKTNMTTEDTVLMLKKMIEAMQKEIEDLRKT
ncbi:MAG: hypothetical protein RSB77_03030 [Bacilli bacterium]